MKVAADVDTGIDDALALIYLAHRQRRGEIDCGDTDRGDIDLAVTTSAGNCTAPQAAANSTDVLRLSGLAYPSVTVGALGPVGVDLTTTPETHGPGGLGYHRTQASAAEGAYEGGTAAVAARAWQGADYLLVAGPATNLAWAPAHGEYGTAAGARTVLMCGAFDYPGNTTETAEWNAWVDPHALQAVMGKPLPADAHNLPIICPLNVTEQVILEPSRLESWCAHLRKQGRGELAALLADALRFYFEFHESVGVGYCAQIHDLAAAMVLLDAVPYRTRTGVVNVDVEGPRRGTTTVQWIDDEPRGIAQSDRRAANAQIVVELDATAVFAEFERVVLGE